MQSNHPLSLPNTQTQRNDPALSSQQFGSDPQLNRVSGVSGGHKQNIEVLSGHMISVSEFNSQVYAVKFDMLKGHSINQLIRAKLRVWLYEECSRLKLPRRICCLGTTLMDLYFSYGGLVTLEEFHTMGLTCLLLSNKLLENYLIPVDHGVFPKKDLVEWEEKICWKLCFRISPITYVQFMDSLIVMWNQFAKNHSLWSYSGFEGKSSEGSKKFDAKRCYEILDYLHLFLKSYRFPKGSIECLVLSLVLEEDAKKIDQDSMSIEDEVLINFWENPEENSLKNAPFDKIFQEFEIFLIKSNFPVPNVELAKRKEMSNWVSQVLPNSKNLYSSYECQIWCQTSCEGWFKSVKQILRPVQSKNCRKSSSDTTI